MCKLSGNELCPSRSATTTPQEAIETAVWKCEHCGYVHSKETDLPFDNWEENIIVDSTTALRFWEGFSIATNIPIALKQCNVCTKLMFNAFSKHSGCDS